MNKKYGPLPLWAWGLAGGVILYLLYRYYSNSSSSSSNVVSASTLDPNAVDPNTGLTYGQEESAALNANAASVAGSTGGAGSGGLTESSAQGQVSSLSQELTDFGQFASTFEALSQTLNPSSVNPSTTSSTTQAAAASPPMQAQASPPTINVTVNSAPAQTAASPSSVGAPAAAVQRMSTGALKAAGAVLAPFGHTAPTAPPGFKTVGTGGGNWQFVPLPISTKPPKSGTPFGGFRP